MSLKIWGGKWEFCKEKILKDSIQNRVILGDEYALGINGSLINLGILHEKVKGASSGDLITSRTFHIPGSGGFMIHESSKEISNFFIENEEIAIFNDNHDLIDKIKYLLQHKKERERIMENGYNRAHNDHSLDNRAADFLQIINNQLRGL